MHEEPRVPNCVSDEVLSSDFVLQPGMILCIEVGCFGSDLVWFGNMPEDIYLVTETGLDLIGVDLPRDIWLCG